MSVAVAVALLSAASYSLTACSDDGDQPSMAQMEVDAGLREIQRAFVAGDGEEVCGRLTKHARAEVSAAGHGPPIPCRKNIGRFMSGVQATGARRGAPLPSVASIDVTAVMATLDVGAGHTLRVPMVKENGEWKLGDFLGFSPKSRLSR